ncbi:unnamed protein product [Didymodactylos carnosus]|uniref:NAD(P)(+)--arginine ADP-ribosyltransferase n=1 Tax=Didymodactylos carnosus TaxID=1234261 RepID=A0A815RTY3_9BILA|nr:unnamed protein product [Didymodactylos carnosus]CAF1481419.1 unnamed protein product [Didymodactylos carnosus]CAF3759460.1 unnamed protein product [Didymodactylos carnosus]CAF4346407.1 unnamed protein product [Didymodactylos carnosus]
MGSRRYDRFDSAIPGITEKLFNKSKFLKYYDRTESCPCYDDVIDSLLALDGIDDRSHPVCRMIKDESADYDVIKTYTSEHRYRSKAFYSYVNKQLLKDRKSRLEHLMPFIRRATHQINHRGPDDSCVVYRGMDLNREQVRFFTPGKIFRFPGFTSTTTDRSVAESFGDILFKIRVPADISQARNIADISCFPSEDEWLFVPYSRFKVISSENRKITLEAKDNLEDVSESTTSSDESSDTD